MGGWVGGWETYLERVNDVAQGLAHFASVFVAHHRVEVDGLEGEGFGELWGEGGGVGG